LIKQKRKILTSPEKRSSIKKSYKQKLSFYQSVK